MTLDDLERPIRTLFREIFFPPLLINFSPTAVYTSNLMKPIDLPYFSEKVAPPPPDQ